MKIRNANIKNTKVREVCAGTVEYNICTVSQLAYLANCSIATIEGRIRPYVTKKKSNPKLTVIYPFKTPINAGPKFVVVNDEFEAFIAESLRLE